jgi:hypothetical protein
MFERIPCEGFTKVVFAFFAHSKYMPCPDCGASFDGVEQEEHVCDGERRLDFQLFRLRGQFARFELDLARFLESPQGRFEVWYAARERLAFSSLT